VIKSDKTVTEPKKIIERRALEAACRVSAIIPAGNIQDFEKPDFKIEAASGLVGIEVTELLPPPRSEVFASPLAERDFHHKLMALAEEKYSALPDSVPVGVGAYFWKIESGKRDLRSMACELAEFVRSHRKQATPVENFSWRPDLPEGFEVITISAINDRPWYCGESISLTLDQIKRRLGESISAKNKLLPTYRANMPNAPIHLLIYSCMEVSRGVPIPHGLSNWTFPFEFDRVFFFSRLDNAVVELCRG
jgi:hypothetical protein